MNMCLYTESSSTPNSLHWSLRDGTSRGRKSHSPPHFPNGVAHSPTRALHAWHDGSSCLNTLETSRETEVEASLLTLKHCLKKPWVGWLICKGCEAAGWEAGNTCQLNSGHLWGLGGSDALWFTPSSSCPLASAQSPTLLLHQKTRWYPTREAPNHSREKKKWRKFFNLQDSCFLST